jgi:hypothetical protein
MDRFFQHIVRVVAGGFSVWVLAFFAASMTANAQFKVVGPPPYSPTVARQKIRTLLDGVDPAHRQQTI